MQSVIIENCELEWQWWRGVLYVNNKDTGSTVLRVSGIKIPDEKPTLTLGSMIDVLKARVISDDTSGAPAAHGADKGKSG